MEELLQSIADEIKDIFDTDIETTQTATVPTRNDATLTFSRGITKKGKLLETCVLFIDIRNSTRISKRLKADKRRLGKIYSAFVHAMSRIADEYGFVRNIIGDRVMVVFDAEDCYARAVKCAILMYTVSMKMLKIHSALDDFKVGIGIEHGEMLVLKAGIPKRHEEQSEYKNLVWVGDTANVASKLTDYAAKEYNAPIYKVTYESVNFERVLKTHRTQYPLADLYFNRTPQPPEFEFKTVTRTSTISLNQAEFAAKVTLLNNEAKYDGYKVTNISKENRNGYSSPILMSAKVFSEWEKKDSKSTLLQYFSKKDYPDGPYVLNGIYGGSAILPEIKNIKI